MLSFNFYLKIRHGTLFSKKRIPTKLTLFFFVYTFRNIFKATSPIYCISIGRIKNDMLQEYSLN